MNRNMDSYQSLLAVRRLVQTINWASWAYPTPIGLSTRLSPNVLHLNLVLDLHLNLHLNLVLDLRLNLHLNLVLNLDLSLGLHLVLDLRLHLRGHLGLHLQQELQGRGHQGLRLLVPGFRVGYEPGVVGCFAGQNLFRQHAEEVLTVLPQEVILSETLKYGLACKADFFLGLGSPSDQADVEAVCVRQAALSQCCFSFLFVDGERRHVVGEL